MTTGTPPTPGTDPVGDPVPTPDPTGDAPEPVARGALALLRDRVFGLYYWGKVVSSVGLWVHNITASIAMWELTRSAFLVGAVSMLQFIATLVLGPWTGGVLDRHERRHVLMFGTALQGLSVACLTVIAFADRLTPASLLAMTAINGAGVAFASPAMHALVPSLLPRVDWSQGIALTSALPNLSRAVGPAVGAVLVLSSGPVGGFALATFGHAVLVVCLARLRPLTVPPRGHGGTFDGFRYVVTDRGMLHLLLGVAILAMSIDPAVTLTPSLADALDAGTAGVGVLASSFGVGALAVTMSIGIVRRRIGLVGLARLGFVVIAVGAVTVSSARHLGVAAVAIAIVGAGFLLGMAGMTTLIQERIPEELRGRITAIWAMVFLGTRPFVAAVNGLIADHISVFAAFGLLGLLAAAGMGVPAASRRPPPDNTGRSPATTRR